MSKTKQLVEIGILTAMITILGAIKIPNIIPGVEFQLSAPLAVAICVVFGFKKYIISGCLSSMIGLALGTQSLLSVAISMQFRLIVGLVVFLGARQWWSIVVAGPVGSALARFSLSFIVGKGAWAMIMAAVPGMIFTAVMAPVFVKVLQRLPNIGLERHTKTA